MGKAKRENIEEDWGRNILEGAGGAWQGGTNEGATCLETRVGANSFGFNDSDEYEDRPRDRGNSCQCMGTQLSVKCTGMCHVLCFVEDAKFVVATSELIGRCCTPGRAQSGDYAPIVTDI